MTAAPIAVCSGGEPRAVEAGSKTPLVLISVFQFEGDGTG